MCSLTPRNSDDFIASQLLRFAKAAAKWLNGSARPADRARRFVTFPTLAKADLNHRSNAFSKNQLFSQLKAFWSIEGELASAHFAES